MESKTILITITVLVLVGGFSWWWLSDISDDGATNALAATVYKAPSCGCCVGYSGELDGHGFDVDIVNTEDMRGIKERYNIPPEMESCHTAVIGDYFVEGHVSLEAIDKLLEEQPDIDGIALPDMPAGTPGMPGIKSGSYTIYQLVDGEYSEFMSI